MTGIRTHREAARRRVHDEFAVPALYRADPESDWAPVSVRIHTKVTKFGDLPGLETATFIDISPKMIFLVEDLDGGAPQRGAFVSVVQGEAWRVGESDPADNITVTAAITRTSAAQAATFPYYDANGEIVTPEAP